MTFIAALHSTRPLFLVLAPVCVYLGLQIASPKEQEWSLLCMIMVAAIAAHISVNTFNEYFDFRTGLDALTQKTPFSGGSGALPNNHAAAPLTLAIAILSMVIVSFIGLWLAWQVNGWLLPLGVVGVILIATYTQWINKHPWLCLIAPGVGFGVCVVMGSAMAFGASWELRNSLLLVVPFSLVNNLLLLNQYPDVAADHQVGRKTFPIVYGFTLSHWVYGLQALMASGAIIIAVALEWIPQSSMVSLLPVLLSGYALLGAIRYGASIGLHPQYLAANVAATLLVPLMLGWTL